MNCAFWVCSEKTKRLNSKLRAQLVFTWQLLIRLFIKGATIHDDTFSFLDLYKIVNIVNKSIKLHEGFQIEMWSLRPHSAMHPGIVYCKNTRNSLSYHHLLLCEAVFLCLFKQQLFVLRNIPSLLENRMHISPFSGINAFLHHLSAMWSHQRKSHCVSCSYSSVNTASLLQLADSETNWYGSLKCGRNNLMVGFSPVGFICI